MIVTVEALFESTKRGDSDLELQAEFGPGVPGLNVPEGDKVCGELLFCKFWPKFCDPGLI